MKTSVNIKMDVELRDAAKALFGEMGLDMTTAVNLFLIAALKEQGLPFAVTVKPNQAAVQSYFDEYVAQKVRAAMAEAQNGEGDGVSEFAERMRNKHGLK